MHRNGQQPLDHQEHRNPPVSSTGGFLLFYTTYRGLRLGVRPLDTEEQLLGTAESPEQARQKQTELARRLVTMGLGGIWGISVKKVPGYRGLIGLYLERV